MSVAGASVAEESNLDCVGRFNFRLPATFLATGRDRHLYRPRVWSEVAASPDDVAQLWALGQADFMRKEPQSRPPRVVSEGNLADVGSALWIAPVSSYSDDRKLLAMKAGPNYALFLEAAATAGREPIAERIVTEVANGFVPQAPFGFCTKHGAFDLRASRNESAAATFASANGINSRCRRARLPHPWISRPWTTFRGFIY